MADIIDGKKIAAEVLDEVRERVSALVAKGTTPGLATVLVGDEPASATYVRLKQRAAERIGMASVSHRLPQRADPDDLAGLLEDLNADPSVHGILLQTPLPKHLDAPTYLSMIAPSKDVDGLHPVSQGLLARGTPRFIPCTPFGVQQMLVRTGVGIEGAHAVVVGRSVLVGRPLSILLSNKAEHANATVTLCHTGTRDLARHTKQADILVVAAGVPKYIGAEHVSPGAVVIDVGTNFDEHGRNQVGDVDFDAVAPTVRAISPSPGGVGPMTVAMLMWNTALAAQLSVGA